MLNWNLASGAKPVVLPRVPNVRSSKVTFDRYDLAKYYVEGSFEILFDGYLANPARRQRDLSINGGWRVKLGKVGFKEAFDIDTDLNVSFDFLETSNYVGGVIFGALDLLSQNNLNQELPSNLHSLARLSKFMRDARTSSQLLGSFAKYIQNGKNTFESKSNYSLIEQVLLGLVESLKVGISQHVAALTVDQDSPIRSSELYTPFINLYIPRIQLGMYFVSSSEQDALNYNEDLEKGVNFRFNTTILQGGPTGSDFVGLAKWALEGLAEDNPEKYENFIKNVAYPALDSLEFVFEFILNYFKQK